MEDMISCEEVFENAQFRAEYEAWLDDRAQEALDNEEYLKTVDWDTERAYNLGMEDMMKLADVSCEEVYEKVSDSWVSHMSVPNGFDKDDDEGDDLCWCKFYDSCPSCFGKK